MTRPPNAPSYEEDFVVWLETGLPESDFPERCRFGVDEALDPRWLPPRQPLDR
jgi:hypothetical protein